MASHFRRWFLLVRLLVWCIFLSAIFLDLVLHSVLSRMVCGGFLVVFGNLGILLAWFFPLIRSAAFGGRSTAFRGFQ